jgi:endonuclease/exonuclease/phosphatase family metal-dependent hydrolase
MSKSLKLTVWVFALLLGVPVLLSTGFVGYLMLTEFTPEKHVAPDVKGDGREPDPAQRDFTFFTWNIGYGGLGKEQDFFYDGGKTVTPAKEAFKNYFFNIKNLVKANDTVDFIFLQEVDLVAKRSWNTNEIAELEALMPDFTSAYAKNYDCRYVPLPLRDPMGKVVAGLAVFSQFRPQKAEICYFDAYFPWPTRLAMLKRCFLLFRFGLDNGRELVVINTHNSAYDSTGALRKRELFILDSAMQSEYKKGNYVIAGGDWNSNPRGFEPASIISGDKVTNIDPPAEPGFLPGWQFVFDPLQPSNRFLDMSYQKGITRTTIIDFFVVSPNVEVTRKATIPLGFAYSDHDPVVMGVRLK